VLLAVRGLLGLRVVDIGEVPPALVEVEPVADEEFVGNREADVAHGEILDETPVGAVEQRGRRERARVPQEQRLAQVVQREAGVDDVLDDQDVAAVDTGVEILQQPDSRRLRPRRAAVVGGELDEVEVMKDGSRPREICEEDEARLQRRDEERLAPVVLRRDLGADLLYSALNLVPAEVDLADPSV
jgi:hypothetical protein